MDKYIRGVFLTIAVYCTTVIPSYAQYQIDLVENRDDEIILNFQLSKYNISNMVINGETCSYILLPDAASLDEKGFPMLPIISQSVIIPNNAEMSMEIIDIKYNYLNVNKIVPSKGIIYRNQNPADIPYVFGDFYGKNAWYPENPVRLSKPYIMRDIRGIVVYFQPFQYNPVLGKLKIAESMTVKVKSIGVGKINILHSFNRPLSPTYDKIYQRRFINYSQNRFRYPDVDDGDRMIIISPTHYLSPVEPLAEWKNKKGIKTTIHDYISETGGGAEGVLDFIQKKYDSENLTYVLLIGDIQDILAFYVEGRGGDPIYALLSGKDNYPDVFVGRLSGESEAEIQTMVNKVLQYEMEPDPNGEWYHKAMGIASDESQGGPTDKEWMEGFRETMLTYNYTEVDQIYDPGASISDVSNGLNEGRSWINYMGHGNKDFWGTTGFSNRHIAELTNTNKLPVIISVACYNGDFSSGLPCFGEAWLRHGSPTEAKGAVICAASSIMQAWKPPQPAQQEMVKHLTEDTYISVGGIFFNGEMKMIENGDGDITFKSWNLFGDPSLMVFTDKPTAMNVTHPDNVGEGSQQVDIKIDSEIDGRVCIYSDGNGILGSKIISGTSAQLSITVTNEDKVFLTVTARNRIPFQKELSVGPTSLVNHTKTVNIPNTFTARPNPANRNSQQVYFLFNTSGNIKTNLTIYDVVGSVVYKTSSLSAWNCRNMQGKTVAAGIYIAALNVKYENGRVELYKCFIGVR